MNSEECCPTNFCRKVLGLRVAACTAYDISGNNEELARTILFYDWRMAQFNVHSEVLRHRGLATEEFNTPL